MLNRAKSAIWYLSHSSIHRWRLEAARCPLCGPSVFAIFAPDPFYTRCVRCRGTAISLAIVGVIRELGLSDPSAWEMSTYGSVFDFMRANFREFVSSEYIPGIRSGDSVNGVRCEDVQNSSFPDSSLDLITSGAVFEHVPEVEQGLRECRRILKPNGYLLFTVPIDDIPRTVRNAEIRDGKLHWLGVEEYHGSRLTGPNTVPVFWKFSKHDLLEFVKNCGFSEVWLVPVLFCKGQSVPQFVVKATG